jgi:hypothetical protein
MEDSLRDPLLEAVDGAGMDEGGGGGGGGGVRRRVRR